MIWRIPTASLRTKLIGIEEDLRRFPGIRDSRDDILRRWSSEESLRDYGVIPSERFEKVEDSDGPES